MHALTKHQSKQVLSKPGAPKMPSVKTVILDTGDRCYTDASVKVRPHKSDAQKVALKCTDAARLAKAASAMGLKPCGPVIRGGKHWILICWKAQVGAILFGSAPGAPKLGSLEPKLISGKTVVG